MRNCTEDEGRPLGAGDQEPVSNHHELLSLRAMVVSVVETAGLRPCQVRSMKTSESEPSMNCRKRIVDVRTGGGGHSGMSAGGALKTGLRGIRLEGGVSLDQAFVRNRRTCRSDAKGDGQEGSPLKAQRTDAEHRGGTARSRDEGAVMALDRRGRDVQPSFLANRSVGGAS